MTTPSKTQTVAKILHVLITVPFDDDLIQRFQGVSPVYVIDYHPARQVSDIPAQTWETAEILYTSHVVPPAMPRLKWLQSHYAGVDSLLQEPLIVNQPEVVMTSMRGIHATNIAEYALGMILSFGHRIPEMMKAQKHKQWSPDRFEVYLPLELRHATVGIVGYGAIGREVARLVKAFGGKVLAAKRDAKTPEDRSHFRIDGTGDPDGNMFDRLYPPQALPTMVKDCDFVVLTAPITGNTRQLYDRRVIQAMKPGSYLINVGRGGVVDEEALIEALESGHLRGAIMDVFAQEPLPPESPLWTTPNLIITPHIAGNTADYHQKAALVFEENLRRYAEREPLLNLVDREAGY